MRVLVTGAAGFVGHRLCRVLSEQGHEVHGVVHPDSMRRAQDLLAPFLHSVIPADLAALSVADLPPGVEALITLGQARHFREFPAKAEDTFGVNVVANVKLLQWAVTTGVRRVVHASSGGIYGGRKDGQLQETDLLAVDSPLGFYLGSKLCSEIVLQSFRQLLGAMVILRPFFIYGPRQRKDMFVARMIESVQQGRAIQLQGADGLKMNPVYVDDAVFALAQALKIDGNHVINVAGPDVMTLRKMAETIAARVGKRPVFEQKDGAAADYVGETLQAERKLGLRPVTFASGIAKTLGTEKAGN